MVNKIWNVGLFQKSLSSLFLVISVASFTVLSGCLDSASGHTFEEQLEKDLAAIDQYLADNGITALSDPNNFIRYVVHEEGGGSKPTIENCVTTSYFGELFDGSSFDESDQASFPLDGVILGWQIGIPLLQKGDSATLYIPSGFAYGSQSLPGIPVNSNLIFNIRLKDIGADYDPTTRSCF